MAHNLKVVTVPREAIRRTILVEKVFWDCGDPRHHHQTKEVADTCIARQEEWRKGRERKETRARRYLEILELVIAGVTARQLQERLGVSRTRTDQLIHVCLRKALDRADHGVRRQFRDAGRTFSRKDVLQHKEFWQTLLLQQRDSVIGSQNVAATLTRNG